MATEIITGIEALKVNDGISAALSDAFKKLKISVRDSAETPLCKNKGTPIRRPFFRTAIPEQILLPLPLSPRLPLSLTYTYMHAYVHTYKHKHKHDLAPSAKADFSGNLHGSFEYLPRFHDSPRTRSKRDEGIIFKMVL